MRRCLVRLLSVLASNPAKLAEFIEDPVAVMEEFGCSDGDRDLLSEGSGLDVLKELAEELCGCQPLCGPYYPPPPVYQPPVYPPPVYPPPVYPPPVYPPPVYPPPVYPPPVYPSPEPGGDSE